MKNLVFINLIEINHRCLVYVVTTELIQLKLLLLLLDNTVTCILLYIFKICTAISTADLLVELKKDISANYCKHTILILIGLLFFCFKCLLNIFTISHMGLHVFQFTNILVVGLTTDDKFHYLNSEDEFNKILQKC